MSWCNAYELIDALQKLRLNCTNRIIGFLFIRLHFGNVLLRQTINFNGISHRKIRLFMYSLKTVVWKKCEFCVKTQLACFLFPVHFLFYTIYTVDVYTFVHVEMIVHWMKCLRSSTCTFVLTNCIQNVNRTIKCDYQYA